MFVLVSVLCFLAAARADLSVINGAVDKILQETQEVIVKNGSATLPIPEFFEDFTYRWHFIKVKSSLHCWEGMMSNASTLQRVGDVKIANHTDQITLVIPLNLTDFEMVFNNCRVDIKHFLRKTAPVRVKIARNSLEAKVTLNLNEVNKECTATLEGLRVTMAEKVTFDSAAILSEVQERLLPYLTRHFINQLIPFMSNYLNDLVKVYVPNAQLCYKLQ